MFEYLFCDSISKEVIKNLRKSKADRVEIQYYTQQVSVDLEQAIKGTKKFVLEIENVADGLNLERIAELQKRLKVLAGK